MAIQKKATKNSVLFLNRTKQSLLLGIMFYSIGIAVCLFTYQFTRNNNINPINLPSYVIPFCLFISSFCWGMYMSIDNFEKRKIRNFDNMDLLKMESKVDPESISNMAKKASQNESKNDLNSGSNENRDLSIAKTMNDEAKILQIQYRKYTQVGFGILIILMAFYCIKLYYIYYNTGSNTQPSTLEFFLTSLPFTIVGYVGFIFCSKRAYISYMLFLQYRHRMRILQLSLFLPDGELKNIVYHEVVKFEIPTNKPHKNEIDDAIELITKLKELNK